MIQKKVDDKIIEQISNSILDFDTFYSDFMTKTDINLQNDIEIRFLKESKLVEVYIKRNKYVIEELSFDSIIKEILEETRSIKQQELSKQQQDINKKKRDEIRFVGNHTHQLDIAYINFMQEIKTMNAASTYGLYIQKLQRLVRILNIGDRVIDTTEINSLDDLIAYLTKKGFQNIIDDLK